MKNTNIMKTIKFFIMLTALLTVAFSCSKTDPLVSNDELILIPRSFSPDGDTINDTWFITDQDNLIDSSHFLVRVFNDSSQVKVFESTKKNFIWDGTYNGVPQPVGYYSFYFDYKTWNEDEHIRTGALWLYRKQ